MGIGSNCLAFKSREMFPDYLYRIEWHTRLPVRKESWLLKRAVVLKLKCFFTSSVL